MKNLHKCATTLITNLVVLWALSGLLWALPNAHNSHGLWRLLRAHSSQGCGICFKYSALISVMASFSKIRS